MGVFIYNVFYLKKKTDALKACVCVKWNNYTMEKKSSSVSVVCQVLHCQESLLQEKKNYIKE